MFFGHLAFSILAEFLLPEQPSLPLYIASGFIDIINGLFTAVGIDKISPNPDALPYTYFDLDFVDWDHSLLMVIVWSLVYAGILFFLKKSVKLSVASCLLVQMHFVCDILVHNKDLALYPYSTVKIGFGLWGKLREGSWVMEILLSVLLMVIAKAEKKQWAVMASLFVVMSPWFASTKYAISFPEPYRHILVGLGIASGFIVPSLLLRRRKLKLD